MTNPRAQQKYMLAVATIITAIIVCPEIADVA